MWIRPTLSQAPVTRRDFRRAPRCTLPDETYPGTWYVVQPAPRTTWIRPFKRRHCELAVNLSGVHEGLDGCSPSIRGGDSIAIHYEGARMSGREEDSNVRGNQ